VFVATEFSDWSIKEFVANWNI